MGSRTWIKIYCDNWLSGTLRTETPELRGIWADLLALAGSGKYGDMGQISLQNGVGLTDLQIEKILGINNEQWQRAKQRLISTDLYVVSESGPKWVFKVTDTLEAITLLLGGSEVIHMNQ